jgi:hypothetical protein
MIADCCDSALYNNIGNRMNVNETTSISISMVIDLAPPKRATERPSTTANIIRMSVVRISLPIVVCVEKKGVQRQNR